MLFCINAFPPWLFLSDTYQTYWIMTIAFLGYRNSFELELQVFSLEVEFSVSRDTVRNCNVQTTCFKNSLTFLEHSGYVFESFRPTEKGICRAFVDYQVKCLVLKFQVPTVHDLPWKYKLELIYKDRFLHCRVGRGSWLRSNIALMHTGEMSTFIMPL